MFCWCLFYFIFYVFLWFSWLLHASSWKQWNGAPHGTKLSGESRKWPPFQVMGSETRSESEDREILSTDSLQILYILCRFSLRILYRFHFFKKCQRESTSSQLLRCAETTRAIQGMKNHTVFAWILQPKYCRSCRISQCPSNCAISNAHLSTQDLRHVFAEQVEGNAVQHLVLCSCCHWFLYCTEEVLFTELSSKMF